MNNPTNNKNLKDLLKNNNSKSLDDFEKDALEGFNTLSSPEEILEVKSQLDKRIYAEVFSEKKSTLKIYWYAAAGLILLIGFSVYFLIDNNGSVKKNEMAIIQNELTEKKPEQALEQKQTQVGPLEQKETVNKEISKNAENAAAGKTSNSGSGAIGGKDVPASTAQSIPAAPNQSNPNSILANKTNDKDDANELSGYRRLEEEKSQKESTARADKNSAEDISKTPVTDELKTEYTNNNKDKRKKETQIPVVSAGASDTKVKNAADRENTGTKNTDSEGLVSKKQSVAQNKDKSVGGEKNDNTPQKPATSPANINSPKENTMGSNISNCYYLGGNDALIKDIKEKLIEKKLNKKFDAVIYINEKKEVEKIIFTNLYNLNKDDETHIAETLKTLSKFSFFVYPTFKSLFEYKVFYVP